MGDRLSRAMSELSLQLSIKIRAGVRARLSIVYRARMYWLSLQLFVRARLGLRYDRLSLLCIITNWFVIVRGSRIVGRLRRMSELSLQLTVKVRACARARLCIVYRSLLDTNLFGIVLARLCLLIYPA